MFFRANMAALKYRSYMTYTTYNMTYKSYMTYNSNPKKPQ